MDYPTLLDFERREVPVMPAEFFGDVGKGCGYTDTPPAGGPNGSWNG